MRQLRGEDARFVYAESGHANSNITLVYIYDPSTAPGGRVRFKGLLKHIESRLHLLADLSPEAAAGPARLDYPYWIEDEGFDLEYHVRQSRCRSRATGASSASRRRASTRGRSTCRDRSGNSTSSRGSTPFSTCHPTASRSSRRSTMRPSTTRAARRSRRCCMTPRRSRPPGASGALVPCDASGLRLTAGSRRFPQHGAAFHGCRARWRACCARSPRSYSARCAS